MASPGGRRLRESVSKSNVDVHRWATYDTNLTERMGSAGSDVPTPSSAAGAGVAALGSESIAPMGSIVVDVVRAVRNISRIS